MINAPALAFAEKGSFTAYSTANHMCSSLAGRIRSRTTEKTLEENTASDLTGTEWTITDKKVMTRVNFFGAVLMIESM